MNEREMIVATFKRIGHQFEEGQGEDKNAVVVKMHNHDGSLNFTQTTYSFKANGALSGVGVEQFGCNICCELGDDACPDDSTLFLEENAQEELIAKLEKEKA